MPYTKIGREHSDDIELYYKDWGPKNAQPLVFHHGWPLSADDWDTQMLSFLEQGYRVIAHDRRGHGRSSQVSEGHDMDHYAAVDGAEATIVAVPLSGVSGACTPDAPALRWWRGRDLTFPTKQGARAQRGRSRPVFHSLIGGSLMRLLFIFVACCLGANAFAADIKSISRLAAGPGNVLFVADWKAARVHAITLPDAAQKPPGTAFNILDLESLLSKQVGGGRVTVEDMVARPGTAEVYIAVSYGAAKTPALIMVTSDRKARRIDLGAAKSTSTALRDAPTTNYEFWRETPERSFTVTDMKWRDGELFIAGLSNQEFASTLRRLKYPFGSQQSITSVEIYHTGHNLIETRAPIRALSFATLNGKPYLVAAYTCTPIVTIPLDDLKDGAHIRGKTIAELGYGNTPAGMISYTKTGQNGAEDFLMLLNFNLGASVIPVSQVEAASAGPGIDKLVPFGEIAGLDPTPAPLAGALRLDNLDEKSFIIVRRRLEKDALQLVTVNKELSFRLTDFVSEYAFPEYRFKGDTFQLKNIKPRQDMMLKDEGFANQIKSPE